MVLKKDSVPWYCKISIETTPRRPCTQGANVSSSQCLERCESKYDAFKSTLNPRACRNIPLENIREKFHFSTAGFVRRPYSKNQEMPLTLCSGQLTFLKIPGQVRNTVYRCRWAAMSKESRTHIHENTGGAYCRYSLPVAVSIAIIVAQKIVPASRLVFGNFQRLVNRRKQVLAKVWDLPAKFHATIVSNTKSSSNKRRNSWQDIPSQSNRSGSFRFAGAASVASSPAHSQAADRGPPASGKQCTGSESGQDWQE